MNAAAQARLDNIGWAILTVLFIAGASYLIGKGAQFIARLLNWSEADQRRVFWGFLLAGPWISGFIIFVLGPALASLYYSFTDYKLGRAPEWIGLENYRELFLGMGAHGRRFTQAMYNSLYYAVVGVPLQIAAALGMALILNQRIRGVRTFRLIFYLPVILAAGPAVLLAWRYMLSGNGGFVNVALQGLSQRFFLFDWLHRGFIYSIETFNGFFAAVSQGDPIGPLKFVFPAALATLILISLLGDWTAGKRARAERSAELLILVVLGALVGRGLVEEPINPNWTLLVGVVLALGTLVNALAGKRTLARLWQIGGLLVLGAGLLFSLANAGPDSAVTLGYVAACILAAAPLVVSLIGAWDRRKTTLVATLAVALGVILFVRCIPGQLDGGRAGLVTRYLTLQTALDDPTNQDYLEDVYPEDTMSSLWIYGGAAAVLLAAAYLGTRAPRTRRALIPAALVFFGLFGLGALLDTVRYFQAYQTIAAQTGGPVYHFTLFRNSLGTFPDSSRVALWMTNELWAKPSLILISVWSSGAGMLIFLAALQGVPRVLYESAEVDGANRLQRFWKITFPLITPALFYNVVIGVIAALQTFESIYILQTPQNQDSLMSAAYFLFVRTFRQLEIGQGAAASWILVILIVILTTLQFRYSNWVNYEVQQ